MEKKHRPILPLPLPPERPTLAPAAKPRAGKELKGRSKRSQLTKVACAACRDKRTRCDGSRPTCSACQRRVSECTYASVDRSETHTEVLKREYEEVKRKYFILEDLVKLLRDVPEDISQLAIQRLKETSDPETVAVSIRADVRAYSLAGQGASYLPAVQSSLELNFIAQKPPTYASPNSSNSAGAPQRAVLAGQLKTTKVNYLPDLEIGGYGTRVGGSWENPDLSDLSEPPSAVGAASWGTQSNNGQNLFDDMANLFDQGNLWNDMQYIDPRLAGMNSGIWTAVSVSNEYAAGAISMHLETNHPVMAMVGAQRFIEDLVDGRIKYCTPFLFSSLLAFASQAYAVKSSEASARSFEFEQEAETLWQGEKLNLADSCPNVAALVFLHMSHSGHDNNESGKMYLRAGVEMAMRMRNDAAKVDALFEMEGWEGMDVGAMEP